MYNFTTGYHIESVQLDLSYADNITLRQYKYFTNTVVACTASLMYLASTPITQTNQIYSQINSISDNRVDVFAKGSGYVNGHVLRVSLIAVVKNR